MVFLHSQFFALRPFATSSWTTQGTPRIPKRRGNWRKFEKIHGSYEPIWAKLPRLAKPIWPRNLPKNATRCRKAAEARRISSKTYFFPRLRREIIIFFAPAARFFAIFLVGMLSKNTNVGQFGKSILGRRHVSFSFSSFSLLYFFCSLASLS